MDSEERHCVRETFEHSVALSAHLGTVVPLRNTSSHISFTDCGSDPVSEAVSRDFVTPIGESLVVFEKVDGNISTRIDPQPRRINWFEVHCNMWPLALPDAVDPVNLDENIKDVEIPEVLEPSEGHTKRYKRIGHGRQQAHSEACRRRIESLLRGDPSGSTRLGPHDWLMQLNDTRPRIHEREAY